MVGGPRGRRQRALPRLRGGRGKVHAASVSLSDGREHNASLCVLRRRPSARAGRGRGKHKSRTFGLIRQVIFGDDEQILNYFEGLTPKRRHNGASATETGTPCRATDGENAIASATREEEGSNTSPTPKLLNDPASPSETAEHQQQLRCKSPSKMNITAAVLNWWSLREHICLNHDEVTT